jgi:acetyl esterase/lipase
MRRTSALIFAAAAATAAAADPTPVEIWPASQPVPGENGFVCGPETVIVRQYVNLTDRIRYNVSRPALWPYLVANGTGAAVLIAPGGGYHYQNFDDEGVRVAKRMNLMGVSAFVLSYRVPARVDAPGFPYASAELMDAQRAMGVVRSRAAEFGINASRVGFMGFSAGGHLTAHVSTTPTRIYARVDAADDLPSLPDFSLLIYPWKLLLDNNRSATALAPELVVNASHPPAFIAQNSDDTTAWPQGAMLYARTLIESGAPMPVLHLYPKGGHGVGLCSELNYDSELEYAEMCGWPDAAQRFLQDRGLAPGWPKKVAVCTNSTDYYPAP